MSLPIQSMIPESIPSASGVMPQGCGFIEGAKCAASGAALIAGPCNPLGFPESLPACLPAAGAYVGSCKSCLVSGARTALCGAVSAAKAAGIPVPSVLSALC